eukprot:CAMPEP_0194379484 /NCGR_PEP_ID=MMETSP0174-20130528/40067_1 /TAXON_ID=216777 /ORGANISM="Proboscia alata, Strain PI-D3" /LENGTH=404 /DNA_ID=CAMNT_0039162253 /DNA_START=65 /DNA_END=1279 /DNA_ORIENTATION=-
MAHPPSSRLKILSAVNQPNLRGVVFDMDGTLTVPNLDFDEMYSRCEVPRDQDILEAVALMDAEKASKARGVIEEIEEEGRQTLRLTPGAAELGRWLAAHKIPMALVTRNTQKTVKVFEENLWFDAVGSSFSPSISRDFPDGIPPKPDPKAFDIIAKRWSIDLPTSGLVMVGDSPSNDVAFGKAAGASTVLVDSGRKYSEGGSDGDADICVGNLSQVPRMLWKSFNIDSSLGTNVPLLKYDIPIPGNAACKAASNGDVDSLTTMSVSELCGIDESGNTPLIWGADAGNDEVVSMLLGKVPASNLNVRGYLGATAICRASRRGKTEILRMLLAKENADPNIPNEKLQHPLHFAAFKKQPNAVNLLLQHGANPLVLDRKGRTPAEDTSDESIRDAILAAADEILKKQ